VSKIWYTDEIAAALPTAIDFHG